MVEHRGTVSQALDVLVDMMKELNPEALRDVDAELLKRRLEIRSRGQRRQVGLEGGEQQVRMRFDRFALGQIEGEGESRQLANRAAGTLLEMDEWPRNQMARFRAMFGTNSRLAVIGLILEGLAAGQMTRKMDESMAHQRTENTWRMYTSWASIIGGVGNLIHDNIINRAAMAGGLRLAKAKKSIWVRGLGLASRGLGVVAAGVMALWDLKKSVQEGLRRDFGTSALYLFSATAGAGAAIFLSGWLKVTIFGLSSTGWGIILVFAAVGFSLWIEFIKNNALQDWMERSYFGKLENERYESPEMEMEQLELAMEALGVEAEGEEEDNSSSGLVPQAG